MDRNRGRLTAMVVIRALAIWGLIVGTGSGATGFASAATPSFSTTINNPYLPFTPGTTLIYKGVRDGRSQTDRVTVTNRTKVVNGVETVVVRDVARHKSLLIEKTFDWYAQADDGAVWYFGENTKEYDEHGNVVSTEGSWTDGVDGAVRGIVMQADPQVPDGYRQEFYPGHAEDTAWVIRRGGSLDLPYGTAHHVLRRLEFTRLEPKVVDSKFYAPGIGIVREFAVAGGQEAAELVKVIS
jgi:hypothetical protein